MRTETSKVATAWRASVVGCVVVLCVLALARPGAAQATAPSCTASLLNRTVMVKEDGSFLFAGVPAEPGPHRVRLTCQSNGLSFGQSDLFLFVPNGFVLIGPIAFGNVTPVPVALELRLAKLVLTGKGEPLDLTTVGILGDGTEVDFSATEMGTEFWSSDPRLASIEYVPAGAGRTLALLRAHERGKVLVAARVEGVLTTVEIDLQLPNDADHDGMPDDYEIAKGFDPNNPNDALLDLDGDGLNNLQEFLAGTDPRQADTDADGLSDRQEVDLGTKPADPDSDGDGLLDGQEVDRGTNPLVADSDGDGLLDGIEAAIGSDPRTADTTTAVRGRVIDSEGVAVQGAAVVVFGRIVATTDRTGAFLLAPVPADLGPLTVFARILRGSSALDGTSAPTAPVAGDVTDVGTIRLVAMNSRVSGKVLDAFGRSPVPGARVIARTALDVREGSADASGVFAFDRMAAGMIHLEATDPRTGLRGRADVSLAPDGEAAATIVLGSFGAIEGRALGRDAATPVGPGVTVNLIRPDYADGNRVIETTVTGRESTYRFPFVPLATYLVETSNSAGDRGRTTVVIQATSETVTADISFLGRGTVTGVVNSSTGTRVANAPVTIDSGGIFKQQVTTVTTVDGTFTVSGVFVGPFSATATDPVTALSGHAPGELRNEADHDAVTIVLPAPGRSGTLVGTVFDADGTTPVPGATVDGAGSTVTGADGSFRYSPLALGDYALSAQHPSLPSCGSAGAVLTNPNETVRQDIVLRGTAGLRVKVLYADGTPASAAAVSLSGGTQCPVSRGGTADADGMILFTPLPVGSFSVNASGPVGGVRGSVQTTLRQGEDGEVTILLEAVGSIAGRVLRADGTTPVSGMRVDLVGVRSTRSAADGSFRFDQVKVNGSPYGLRAVDGQGVVMAEELNVALGQQGDVATRDLKLIPLGAVTGRVFSVQGGSQAGARVTVSGSWPYLPRRYATTDAAGVYRVEQMAAIGTVAVEAVDDPGFKGSATGTLTGDGAVVTVDVHLGGEALVADLWDANNYHYPIEYPNGGVRDGSLGLFSVQRDVEHGGLRLSLGQGGSFHRFLASHAFVSPDGREGSVEGDDPSGLFVRRRARVPKDGYFVRYVEELENRTSQPITVDLRLESFLSFVSTVRNGFTFSDPAAVAATSSGDLSVSAGDRWAVVAVDLSQRPQLEAEYPSYAQIFDGPGGRIAATSASYDFTFGTSADSFTRLRTQWSSLTVAPGARVLLLHFAVQETGIPAARAAAERLVQLPPEAYEGLDAGDLDGILNFAANPAGASALPALPALDGTVSGRVLQGDHATPVANARVMYQSDHPLYRRMTEFGADAAGSYRLQATASNDGRRQVVPRSSYKEQARSSSTQQISPSYAGDFPGGGNSSALDLIFTGTSAVFGEVRRSDGNVVSFGQVTLRAREQLVNLTAGLPTAGTFRFPGLPPDAYSLVAVQPHPQGTGLKGAASAVVQGDGQDVLANVVLDPIGNVEGIVRAGDGNVAPNLRIMLTSPTAPDFLRSAVTDTGGAYRFFDVAVGRYTLTVEEPVTHIASRVDVMIAVNQTLTRDIDLFGIGDIQVIAHYPDGTPVVKAPVRLQVAALGPFPVAVGTTDTEGRLLIEDVPTGTFSVEVRHPVTPEDTGNLTGQLAHGGDTATAAVTVPFDHAPTIELVSPVPGTQTVRGQTVLFQANAADDFKVARVEFAVNGTLVATVTAPPYRATVPFDAAPGAAEARATAIDSGGNRTSVTVTVTVLGDSTPPTVAITRPISGTTAVEGTAVTIEASAGDNIRIDRVEFRAGANLVGTARSAPFAATFTLPRDFAPTTTVTLPLTATAYDSAGNSQTASSVLRVVPDRAPTITMTESPADGVQLPEGAPLHFAATAADDVDVDVDLYLNGQRLQSRGIAPFTFDLQVPHLQAGQTNPLTYQLVARDSRGQTASAPPVHVTVLQDHPPTVAITAPADGAEAVEGSTVTVQATAGDDVGVRQVELYADGVRLATLTAPPYSATFQLAAGLDGSRVELRAVATDSTGQTTEAVSGLIRRHDATAPTIAIASPVDGATVALGPTDVVIAIDNSAAGAPSTGADFDGDGNPETVLAAEILAARQILARLTSETSHVAVMRLAGSPQIVQGLTDDFTLVEQRLAELAVAPPVGASDLAGGLQSALQELGGSRARRDAGPVVILLAASGGAAPAPQVAKVIDSGALVHSLDFGALASPGPAAVAAATGGASARVRSAADLANALPQVLSSGNQLAITVAASDDVAVRSVTFRVTSADGSFDREVTDSAPPFATSFTTPTLSQPLALTLAATARDFGGNETVSAPVAVTLAPGGAPPQIVRLEPAAGTLDTVVRIVGRFFAPNAADNVVRFNGGAQAAVMTGTKFELTVKVPAGAQSGPVTVTTAGLTSNGVAFALDSDGDGLTDEQEAALGTDPHRADTDGDGLSDGDEVNVRHTNPLLADTDGDGLNDGFEVRNGFDPHTAGEQGLDPDGDGLTNLEEQAAGSNPLQADTDGDGLNDGAEVHTYHTDPTKSDTDGGGVSDGQEIVNHTNPLDPSDDAVSLPRTLTDGAGIQWQLLAENGSQGIANDGGFAFNPLVDFAVAGFSLITDDTVGHHDRIYFGSTDLNRAVPEDGGRELKMGPSDRSGLHVYRKVFVPSDDSFVRYLEIFENPTAAPVAVRAEIDSRVGTEAATEVIATSGGDLTFGVRDRFIVTDDADNTGRPAVAHVIAGPNARILPAEAFASRLESEEPGDDKVDYVYRFTVPPGETRAILHFGVKNPLQSAVAAKVDDLLALRGRALSGLSATEQAAILNFFAYPDADLDGLSDADEAALGTDPHNPDSDGDGLLDGFEVKYGFNPLQAGEQHLDPDGDGLDNLAEQAALSNPLNQDTDGDGINDGAEVAAGTEPSLADTDGDGLADGAEAAHGTDPKQRDTDHGGVPDGAEVTGQTNPLDPLDDQRKLVPTVETDGLRWRWDLTSDGRIPTGTNGAFSNSSSVGIRGGFESFIDGLFYPDDFATNIYAEDGVREYVLPKFRYTQPQSTPFWQRKVFIPADDGFIRVLDVFEPFNGQDMDVELKIQSTLGSGNSTVLVRTGSGDQQFLPNDDWIVTDDLDGVGRPAIAHVIAGPTGLLRPDHTATNAPGGSHVEWSYHLHIPAGEKRAILSFGVQRRTRAEALATADRLAKLGGSALSGLSPEEQAMIVNFFAYPDADGDRLSDADEARLGTDPNNPDTDGDGLTDGYEAAHGLDPRSAGDAHLDPDGDGLDNLAEFNVKTDPRNPDTDGDGLSDGDEVLVHHTNPLVTDTDGDGLSDGDEVHVHHTNPTLADTDGGGRSDGDEVHDGTDPLNPVDDFGERPLPAALIDQGGFNWDVQRNGSIGIGSLAWNGAARLQVDGASFPDFSTARLEPGGRELLIGPWAPASGVQVTRKVFVPADDSFARYLEVFDNPTADAKSVRVTVATTMAGDAAVRILTTSSGDAALGRNDHWVSLDDAEFTGAPPAGLAFAGPAARLRPDSAVQAGALTTVAYEIRIPAGGRVILMHFLTQQGDRSEATAKAADLERLRGSALFGLNGGEAAAVANFFAFPDRDADGLSDADEAAAGTDPDNPDSDGDGLLDGFETRNGFNPLQAGEASLDPDGDGLDNAAEQAAGTDPHLADTDGDGLSDGAEVLTYHTDPLDADSDEGGRTDREEIEVDGTDPNDGSDDFRPTDPPTVGIADSLGYRWVFFDSVISGATTGGAFSSGALLDVANQQIFNFGRPLGSPDQRSWVYGPLADRTGLLVTRKIYVPGDAAFARYVETFENPTAAPVTALIDVRTYLGSLPLFYAATSSGDETLDAGDRWIVTDDEDGDGAPAVVHLFAGPGGRLAPVTAYSRAPQQQDLQFTYKITVPPGGRVALMHFEMLRGTRADAATAAADLSRLPAVALARLSPADQAAIANFFAYLDSDGDGLSDADEAAHGTNPNLADTDGDGLSDGYEVAHGLDPLSAADGALDPDGDGLTNLQEFLAHTDPHRADTDGDGLSDGAEVLTYGTDPTRADTDGDGLRDGREVAIGTDPKRIDSDGGGATDGEEVLLDGTDPLVAADDLSPVVIDGDVADSSPRQAVAVVDKATGDVHLAWIDGPCPSLWYSLRDHLGRARIAATRVSGECGASGRPALAVDGLGHVHLAWSGDDGGGSTRLWYARLDPSRDDRDGSPADLAAIALVTPRWVAVEPVPDQTLSDLAPSLVADAAGVAHVAWIGGKEVRQPGNDHVSAVLHATRISAAVPPAFLDRVLAPEAEWQVPDLGRTRFGIALDAAGDVHLALGALRVLDPADPGLYYWLLDSASHAPRIDTTRVWTSDTELPQVYLTTSGSTADLYFVRQLDSHAVRLHLDPSRDDRNGDAADPALLVTSGPDPFGTPPAGSPTTSGLLPSGIAFDRDGGAYFTWNAFDLVDPHVALLAQAFAGDGSRILPDLDVRRRGDYVRNEGEIDAAADNGTFFVPWVRNEPTGETRLVLSVVNPDTDGDGLSNLAELAHGTDPHRADTDGDGARDGFEVRYGFDPLSAADGALDADGDGLTNAAEDAAGTDPRRADTDGDGLSDGQEVNVRHTDPTKRDTDGDGLDDRDETLRGTDPTRADTDGDGLPDGVEVARGLDPTSPADGAFDADGDGATAGEEYLAGTDPARPDTDGDGLSDGQEIHLRHTDPLRADTDGDGLTDGAEVATYGTNPNVADSDGGGRGDGQEIRLDGTNPALAGDDHALGQLNENPNADQPVVARDAAGNVHVAWLGGDCTEITYTMIGPDGGVRIDDTLLTHDCALLADLRMAAGPAGTIHFVWRQDGALYHQEIDPSRDDRDGSAADPAAITTAAATAVAPAGDFDTFDPDLAVGSDGRVHLTWAESFSQNSGGLRQNFERIHYEQLAADGSVRLADRAAFDCKAEIQGGNSVRAQGPDHRSHVNGEGVAKPRLAAAASGAVHLLFTCEGTDTGLGVHELMLDGATGGVLIADTNLAPASTDDTARAVPQVAADGAVTVAFERGPIAREIWLLRFQPSRDDRDGSAADPAAILELPPTQVTASDGIPSDHPDLALDGTGAARITFFEHPTYRLDLGAPRLLQAGADGHAIGSSVPLGAGTLRDIGDADRVPVVWRGSLGSTVWRTTDPETFESAIRLLRLVP